MEENRTKEFEDTFHKDLATYLETHDLIDKHFPEAPDIEALWATIGESYLPDALREWNHYPTVALGWVMYIGMAIAYYWDEDWERYTHVPDLYKMMILNTDFDHLDDYIRQQVLHLTPEQGEKLQQTVGECAARTYNTISHLHVEPGTPDAFRVFIAALHEMYLMGAAMELKSLGYHMEQC